MDKIRFERIIVRNYAAHVCAKIYINDIPFLDTVCEYEKKHISYDKGYEPGYEYCCAAELYEQIDKALATKKKTKIYLLVCGCMIEGCNSFESYIHETKKHIILSRFHNYRFAEKKNIMILITANLANMHLVNHNSWQRWKNLNLFRMNGKLIGILKNENSKQRIIFSGALWTINREDI